MAKKAALASVLKHSDDVVARDIHGEFIIIPITSGVGKADEEIYTLNKFGKAIWNKMDGKRSLKAISEQLVLKFEGRETVICKDVLGLADELLSRKMVVKAK
jgi:methyltransferase-like protein